MLRRAKLFMLIALAASVALHSVVLMTVLFNAPTHVVPTPVEKNFVVLVDQPSTKQTGANKSRLGLKRAKKVTPSLAALLPDFKTHYGHAHAVASSDDSGTFASDQPFDAPQAYSMRILPQADQDAAAFIAAIYRRIDGRVVFQSLLAQYGHFGHVFVEFEVDSSGRLSPTSIRGSGTNRILKVYAIRTLIGALKESLPEVLRLRDRTSIKLRAQFQFISSQTESSLFDQNPLGIAGRALTFRRYTAETAVARTLAQHLGNGGVSLDLFAMAEAWKKYGKAKEHRREDVDPFSELRADAHY